jgi:3-isopropylmalate/(R)-2-methylmalate dehydratase large subunit
LSGLTITEKILARAAGKEKVTPGEIVDVAVDLAMTHDHQGPMAMLEFSRLPVPKVWDPSKVIMVIDHRTFSQTVQASENHRRMRTFAREQGIESLYEGGNGICHDLVVEQGHVLPGMLFVATDSHTVTAGALGAFATGIGSSEMAALWARGRIWLMVPETFKVILKGRPGKGVTGKDVALHLLSRVKTDGFNYRAVEFRGPGLAFLSMDSRLSLCNMTLEMGAKNAIVPPDQITSEYLRHRVRQPFTAVDSDPGARYAGTLEIDLDQLSPQVARPYSPDNVEAASVVETGDIAIDQAVIGTCTNARYEDLAAAAAILVGRRVAPGVRLLIVPATKTLWLRASKEGLLDVFTAAGAAVSFPCCGPCGAYGMGAVTAEEVCVTTGSRNFVARLGDPSARIYLGSAATVAASAVAGKIVDPRGYF